MKNSWGLRFAYIVWVIWVLSITYKIIILEQQQQNNENRFRVIADRLYLDMTEKELKEIEK